MAGLSSPAIAFLRCESDMHTASRLLAFAPAVVAAVLCVLISAPAIGADNEEGKAKFEACAACHNANGISTTEKTPSLAGQTDRYLQWQLVYFRSGIRKSPTMNPIAEALSNEDIRSEDVV